LNDLETPKDNPSNSEPGIPSPVHSDPPAPPNDLQVILQGLKGANQDYLRYIAALEQLLKAKTYRSVATQTSAPEPQRQFEGTEVSPNDRLETSPVGQTKPALKTRPRTRQDERPRIRQDEKPPARQDDRLRIRQDERVPPRQDERQLVRQDEKPLPRQDERLRIRQDERPIARQDERLRIRQDEKPPARQDERLRFRQDERPIARQDERLRVRQEERQRIRQDERPRKPLTPIARNVMDVEPVEKRPVMVKSPSTAESLKASGEDENLQKRLHEMSLLLRRLENQLDGIEQCGDAVPEVHKEW
jgi:hypothetical protein